MDPETLNAKPAERVRALASWPLDTSGACPAALSPAAILERADAKQASKAAPAAKRAALRVVALVADVAENVFKVSTFSLEPGVSPASPFAFPGDDALTPAERGRGGGWLAADPKDGALSLLAATADASPPGGATPGPDAGSSFGRARSRWRSPARCCSRGAPAEERGGGGGGRLARPPQLPGEPGDADPRREGAVRARHEG